MVLPSTWVWIKARVNGKYPQNRQPLSKLLALVGLPVPPWPLATLMITQTPPGLLPHMGLPHFGQLT